MAEGHSGELERLRPSQIPQDQVIHPLRGLLALQLSRVGARAVLELPSASGGPAPQAAGRPRPPIAGEHEDFYDPDFCIYNDVFVERARRPPGIYRYPKDVFPPTDFHTATLVGDEIILIGSLGYRDLRRAGRSPGAEARHADNAYRTDRDNGRRTRLDFTAHRGTARRNDHDRGRRQRANIGWLRTEHGRVRAEDPATTPVLRYGKHGHADLDLSHFERRSIADAGTHATAPPTPSAATIRSG